jgi:hypothetical protein
MASSISATSFDGTDQYVSGGSQVSGKTLTFGGKKKAPFPGRF